MLSERETALCSAVLALKWHEYHGIFDTEANAWAPAVGHNVEVRWVPRSTNPYKKHRRHSAELARHLPVCPASVPQRLAWNKHMAGFLAASLGDLMFLFCLLSAGHCGKTQFVIVAHLVDYKSQLGEALVHLVHDVALTVHPQQVVVLFREELPHNQLGGLREVESEVFSARRQKQTIRGLYQADVYIQEQRVDIARHCQVVLEAPTARLLQVALLRPFR